MAKASTTARGYGYGHQQHRRRWAVVVDAGQARCSRCGQPIPPGAAWDLDHDDQRRGYLGPAHAHCNRAAGARKANHGRRRGQQRRRGVSQLRW